MGRGYMQRMEEWSGWNYGGVLLQLGEGGYVVDH